MQYLLLNIRFLPSLLLSTDFRVTDRDYNFAGLSKPPTKDSDVQFIAGIGGAIPVYKNGSILVEADYIRGLMNINPGISGEIHSEGFAIITGFSFAL